ncbi:MAG: molybdopterin-binding domain of aldehyde dehydrogenase family protein, partial [Rhizobium sp.]|nr:molybdopterin-binding domain of aldehyde dehydrogenase family protein [Rhizobium sp.]
APLADTLRAMPSIDVVFNKKGDVDPEFDKAGQTVSASYLWPFQSHGSIGPSCAVADVRKDGDAIIWSASQDVYRHREAIAQLLHMDDSKVIIVYTHGSGCYGHNGADDAGADAALISSVIGRPVRVQWMREDEHAWAPRGSPLLVDLRARLSPEGEVLAWDLKSRSMTFSSRFRYYGKQQSGYVLAAQLAGERADTAIVAEPGRILNTSMTSSTVSPYAFANARTTICALPTAEPHPLRPSELRSVSAIAATFAIESFIDELAVAAKQDPIAFRQAHLNDTRARDVLADVAKLAGWETLPKQGSADGDAGFARGRGVALGLNNTYVAAVAEVIVNLSTGEIKVARLSLAHDCGLIINPDGVKSQIEGNLVQATSRTLFEEVTWDESKITSTDWASYRISKFGEVPETRVSLIDRPSLPSTGAGEPASLPVGAAIGNAVFDAIGIRMRQVPFTPARVKEAMADKLSMQKLH